LERRRSQGTVKRGGRTQCEWERKQWKRTEIKVGRGKEENHTRKKRFEKEEEVMLRNAGTGKQE
jgi:hypothetical protein